MQYVHSLWVNRVDRKAEILRHPTALAEARRLGGLLVSAPRDPDAKPKRVLLVGGERERKVER